MWSDAIQVPECHKTSFPLYEMEDWARQPLGGPISDLSTIPCRAYTDGQNTWYYYSLHFVIAAQPFLCPHPWRVPGLQDIKLLANNDKDLNMSPEWARGEYCCPNVRADEILNEGRYWSSWMHPSTDNEGAAVRCKWTKYWTVVKGEYEVQCHVWDDEYAQCGLQVRCVRD
ncbi:MAG: hypothetical protein LBG96_05385 [Tannerella sp.]|nr:hypothetical protein [Tannerella sp.]